MSLSLRLGLGLSLGASRVAATDPITVTWDAGHANGTFATDDAAGTEIGTLSGGTGAYTLTDDAGSKIALSGNRILIGVGALSEGSFEFTVTSGAETNAIGFEILAATVTEPDDPLPDGTGEDDGGFDVEPTVISVDGGKKAKGKKAENAEGKWLYDLGSAFFGANKTITLKHTLDTSLMTGNVDGVLFGWGFKQGNTFHVTGLRGSNLARGYGTSWSQQTGTTYESEGAATNGGRDQVSWTRLTTDANGELYTISTSADGETWTEEYGPQAPDPLAGIDDYAKRGLALIMPADVSGNFAWLIEAFVEASAEAAFYSGVTRVALNTSTGNQDITIAGLGGTPKAALFYLTRNTANGVVDHIGGSMGAAASDGQWVAAWSAQDNQGTTNTNSRQATDEVAMLLDPTDGSVLAEANFVEFISDGVRINIGATDATGYLLVVMLFGGTELDASAGVAQLATQNNSVTVSPGFQTNALFTSLARGGQPFDDVALDHYLAVWGIGSYDGSTVRQATVTWRNLDASTSVNLTAVVRDDAIHTITSDRYNTFGNVTSTSFDLTAVGTDFDTTHLGYLALGFGGEAEAWVGVQDAPSATGDQNFTGTDFTPEIGFLISSRVDTVNTDITSTDANNLCFGCFTADAEFTLFFEDAEGATTSDNKSAQNQQSVDVSTLWDATFSEWRADGVTLNFSAASGIGGKWPMMLIG